MEKLRKIQYIGLDITNLKNTERALRASNERYEYFNKASNDAMFDWDISTGYINWGNGFFRLFGFTMSDDHTFDKWATLVHPEDLNRIENSLANTIKDPTQSNWLGEYRLKKADGSYTDVEGNGYIIRDDNGNVLRMIGVVKDISERLNYIKAIEEKNKKLLDIAWIQSHDVRAPLANIMALVELLKNMKVKHSDQEITLAHLFTSALALDKKIKTITKTIESVTPKK